MKQKKHRSNPANKKAATHRGLLALLAASMVLAVLGPRVNAASLANDTGCNDSIGTSDGANGGYGFDAWTNVSIGSGGGTYMASTLGGNGCSSSWGIYSGNDAVLTSVQRPFTNYTALSVGQTIVLDMQNGGIDSGGSEGLSLYNSSGNAVFELYYANGNPGWTTNAAGGAGVTPIPYAGSGCRVFFTLVSSTTYSLTVQVPVGGTSYGAYTGTLLNPSGGQSITQLRFFTYNVGSGNNLTFNNIGVGDDAPAISTQPAGATTAYSGATTPAMTVTASSTDGSALRYAWRKRGSGWGNAWSFDNTNANATAFLAASGTTIDTSGQSWGLWQNSGQSTAADAIRVFPTTLAVNQTFSLDLANTNVPTGSSVGFGLQDANGSNAFEFYFLGGSADYFIHDSSGLENDSGMDFTYGGLNVKFTLTSSSTYSVTIMRYSDGKTIINTGTLISSAGAIARVRLFDFISAPYNIYFNNLVVAGSDDNAGNYSGSWSGDLGQKPLADGPTGTGSTNSGSATASFTIQDAQLADSANYDCAVMSGQGYTAISSATTLTVTAVPTNNLTGITVNGDGSLKVTFTGVVGYTYRLQTATNLMAPVWMDVATNTVGGMGTSSFTDTNTASQPMKFYRTVYP